MILSPNHTNVITHKVISDRWYEKIMHAGKISTPKKKKKKKKKFLSPQKVWFKRHRKVGWGSERVT